MLETSVHLLPLELVYWRVEVTYFGVIAADLQEPPELLVDFLAPLVTNVADIVVGRREGREDPAATRISANLFWRLYRIFVNPEIPSGGVDLFGCTRQVRDELVRLEESHSSLVGLLFWVGFRRYETPYVRRARAHGKSSWTVAKKFTYLLDSVFAFTDLPVRLALSLRTARPTSRSGFWNNGRAFFD